MATSKSSRKKTDHYGEGCRAGHARALEWQANPKRGNPSIGGTLQYQVLELAKQAGAAITEHELAYARGEIVGFCYAIECPVHAAACLEADARRN